MEGPVDSLIPASPLRRKTVNSTGGSKLFTKIFWSFILGSLVPLIVVLLITYQNFSNGLQQQIENNLIAISDGRAMLLRRTLDDIAAFIRERASGATVLEAFEQLNTSFKNDGPKSKAYKALDTKYRGIFQRYFDLTDYLCDMLLVSKEGTVIFSMRREKDFGENIQKSFLKGTNLANVINAAGTFMDVQISDFDLYPPSKRPALFIAAPFLGKEKILGTLVFQIRPETLYAFSQNYSGLPKTGEIVFAKKSGDHAVLTTPIRSRPDAAFNVKIPLGSPLAVPLQKAINGETGVGFAKDYRKTQVLARWQYIPELQWGMVVKVDRHEILAPARNLAFVTILLGILTFWIVTLIAFLISKSIADPISLLMRESEIIGQGNLDHKINLKLDNEIGQLSRAFNRMTENLKKITTSKQKLEKEIAERKAAEEKLRRLNAFQSAVMANAGAAIIATTPEGTVISFNKAAETMLGYTADEVVEKMSAEIFHHKKEIIQKAADLSQELNETFAQPGFEVLTAKARKGLPSTDEWTYVRKDGRSFPVLLSVTALRDPQGNILAFLGIATDLTARKEMEAHVLKLSQAIEQSPATIVITDKNGTIEYANPAFEKISGYSLTEALGKNPRVLKSGKHSKEFYSELWKTISQGKVWRGEFYNKKKSGAFYWEAASIAPVRDLSGSISHYVAVKEDITERKVREQELQKLTRELERSNHELNDFAYVVSHDLKAPLRGISSLASWLESDFSEKLGDEGRKQVRLMKERAIHMDDLINGILEYSRIGRVKEQKETVDLTTLVQEVIFLLSPPPHIEVKIPQPLPSVECEKIRIQQVFQNLISNAVHYMDKEKGRITISCQENEREWDFCVADNGPGIDTKHFERIFKLFQTVPVPGKKSGTGIGLSLIKKIVEMHSGRLWVESQSGQGSQFHFTLPKSI